MNARRFLFLAATICITACDRDNAAMSIPKDYPLKHCPISGEPYGSGGMVAYKVTHEGTDVWLCCKSCEGDFEKDPAKFAQMVKSAAAAK